MVIDGGGGGTELMLRNSRIRGGGVCGSIEKQELSKCSELAGGE